MIYIRQLFSAVLLVLWLALNSILNVFLQNWQVYNPGRGKETREDNTDRYHKLMQETRPGLDVVRMEVYEKGEIQNLSVSQSVTGATIKLVTHGKDE